MIEKRNYTQGDYEEITEQSIGEFTLNTWGYIKLDTYFKFLFSDPVVKVASTSAVISTSDYELLRDDRYTTLEAADEGSGKTIYAQLKITNATYAGVELALDCNNFGTYTDNEAVESLMVGFLGDFAGTTAPDGWLACDGSAISRTIFWRLFAKIGETWGAGDGSTTFNLPDLRGVFLRGAGGHGTLEDANGDAFDGGSVGDTANDKFQGHYHQAHGNGTTTFGSGIQPAQYSVTALNSNGVREAITDGTNGTPRTGNETQPVNATVLRCIKY